MKASVLIVMLVLLTAGAESRADDGAAAVLRWNEAVLAAAEAEDGFLTLKGLRSVSMMHLSMHDALTQTEGTNPENAAMFAAFVVATDQYPDLVGRFEALLGNTLTGELSALAAPFRKAIDRGSAGRSPRRSSRRAMAMAGTASRNTAGTRWGPAYTRNSLSTAARRRVSYSAPGGHKREVSH